MQYIYVANSIQCQNVLKSYYIYAHCYNSVQYFLKEKFLVHIQ